MRVGIV